jgi:hypothetical protein
VKNKREAPKPVLRFCGMNVFPTRMERKRFRSQEVPKKSLLAPNALELTLPNSTWRVAQFIVDEFLSPINL